MAITEMEKVVLGSLMVDRDICSAISVTLTPESFQDKKHGEVFRAIQNLEHVTKPNILEWLEKEGKLYEARRQGYLDILEEKGRSFLKEQKEDACSCLKSYVQSITQNALRTRIAVFFEHMGKRSSDKKIGVEDLIKEAEDGLFELSSKNIREYLTTISDEEIAAIGKTREKGLPSGFTELDSLTMGWQQSNLIIIAGRTSTGKTALALSMAKNMADSGHRVAFFSLEMSKKELIDRLAANVLDEPINEIKEAGLESDQEDQIRNCLQNTIFIDETESISVPDLRSRARRAVKEHNIKCVFVDYLQLITASDTERYLTREQEVTHISHSLKSMAKELKLPVIALAQPNRAADDKARKGMEPDLSDLRESGAIEQDADVVCFIHEDKDGGFRLLIKKHRNGPKGELNIDFNMDLVRFENPGQKYMKKKEDEHPKSSQNELPF